MEITRPRGTQDILPPTSEHFRYIKDKLSELYESFGYSPIETPIFEHTELFLRLGESTDVVQKEMYTFNDRKGRSLTLRPELTAPVVRATLEAGLHRTSGPKRFYYFGPIFRYERPQRGRYRQAHQFGIEALGVEDPSLDLEVITLAIRSYEIFGLKNLSVSLNSIGCRRCRPSYREALMNYLREKVHELCDDCKLRYERNPLRTLDCKVDRDKLRDAPKPLDYLCEDCRAHFSRLRELLDKAGIPYEIDPHLVRGLDYYNRTVFEIRADVGGRTLELAGGGRYDYLAEEIGAKEHLPGVGFAGGLERLYMILEEAGLLPEEGRPLWVLAPLSSRAEDVVAELMRNLNPAVRISITWGANLRRALKYADRRGAELLIFMGDRELDRDIFIVRDLRYGAQRELPLSELKGVLEGKI